MSIKEKIANAKTTDWLSQGLEEQQIKEIKELALIAAKIELKRNSLGMTQKEFAKKMGVSQGMVSRWESGTYNFTIATLNDICKKLELEFEPTIRDNQYCRESGFESIDISIRSAEKSMQVWKALKDWHGMEEIA